VIRYCRSQHQAIRDRNVYACPFAVSEVSQYPVCRRSVKVKKVLYPLMQQRNYVWLILNVHGDVSQKRLVYDTKYCFLIVNTTILPALQLREFGV
jgi:hypothetical protein